MGAPDMAALLASWDAANGLTAGLTTARPLPPNLPRVSWEWVTPAMAQELLDHHNTHNRPVTQARVNGMATDMGADRWEINGEAIKVATDGTLLDGQHRLGAVVKSGVPVVMLVVRDLPMRTQATMDAGAKRTAANQLTLAGEANTAQLAAVLRQIWFWQANPGRVAGQAGGYTRPPTNAELFTVLEANPELRQDMPLVSRLVRNANMPGQVAGLAVWLLRNVDADEAATFFDMLETGLGLTATHPIYVLRKYMLQRPVAGDRHAVRIMVALTVKAWNRWRAGEECKVLTFKQGGTHPEAFPVPV